MNVALPGMSRDFGASASDLQRVVDGYVLAFASLLLTGDRYGRRRMFLIGLAPFTASSLLCGLSQSTAQLILARGLQGAAAAMLMPGTLASLRLPAAAAANRFVPSGAPPRPAAEVVAGPSDVGLR